MGTVNRHWTDSTESFLFRVALDYISQIEIAMEEEEVSQTDLAKTLGITKGRVSQVLNNPGNLTLRRIIEYARALGKKVAIVAYDDGDPDNHNGPINSDIFQRCWKDAGRPVDFFDLAEAEHPI